MHIHVHVCTHRHVRTHTHLTCPYQLGVVLSQLIPTHLQLLVLLMHIFYNSFWWHYWPYSNTSMPLASWNSSIFDILGFIEKWHEIWGQWDNLGNGIHGHMGMDLGRSNKKEWERRTRSGPKSHMNNRFLWAISPSSIVWDGRIWYANFST